MTFSVSGNTVFWEWVRVLGWRALLFCGVAGAIWGSLKVKEQVLLDPRFDISQWNIEFGEFPAWVNEKARWEIEAVRETALLPIHDARDSVLTAGLLAEIRAALLQNAWIGGVPYIRLFYPGVDRFGGALSGGLVAELQLRQPVAAVSHGGRLYLSDFDSRRLGEPLEMVTSPESRVPIIFGATDLVGESPPESGEFWRVRAVEEGVSVAAALFRAGLHRHVDEIDVSNVGGTRPLDPEVLLRVQGWPPLAWGRSPISRGARLLTVEQKLTNLEKVLGCSPERLARLTLIRLYAANLASDSLGVLEPPGPGM